VREKNASAIGKENASLLVKGFPGKVLAPTMLLSKKNDHVESDTRMQI